MTDSVRRMATVQKTVDRLAAIARGEAEADPDRSEPEQTDQDDEQSEAADTEGGGPDDTQA